MPLQKLQFKPGITRDLTALAAEGGWYSCDKVRFRMGFPEKIGGWQSVSAAVFLGVCRSIAAWRTLIGQKLHGVGTHLKMYVNLGGVYSDITPIRASQTIATNAFTTAVSTPTVTANVPSHGATTGDYVTISGAVTAVGGITTAQLNGDYAVTVTGTNTFTFTVSSNASSNATGGNGVFDMQISPGNELDSDTTGWGAGVWSGVSGTGGWGLSFGTAALRVWNQVPYGENLVFGPAGGKLYYFTPTLVGGLFQRGVEVSTLGGAASVPLFQDSMFFSPAARILVLCGTNGYGTTDYDPLMVRWSDSESIVDWVPAVTGQAGEYRLPNGSRIVAAASAKQDMLLLTDTTAYLMQYVGAPFVFSFPEQADNISIIDGKTVATTNGMVFWMGLDKFYAYDGRVQTLPCPLRKEVFGNINKNQTGQFFAGTNEGFDEVWWYYCSASSNVPDRYVTYNYVEKTWVYGALTRTAWLDSPLFAGPSAATYDGHLVLHEVGVDDASMVTPAAIEAYIESAAFDIGDGQNFAFVNKVLPDVSFDGSTAPTPAVYMQINGRKAPGAAVGSTPNEVVARPSALLVDQWTEEVDVRLRERQMTVRIESDGLGVQWQLGTPRINVRPDGRKA